MKFFVMDHTGHSTVEFTEAQRAEAQAVTVRNVIFPNQVSSAGVKGKMRMNLVAG